LERNPIRSFASLKKNSDPAGVLPLPSPSSRTDRVLVPLFSSAIFIFAHFPGLTRRWVINDDVRQQIFWMQQWQDPQLFPGDLLADYARHYVPWGVKGLYWLASWFLDPITFSKVLPGLLFVFLGWCFFRIGVRLGSRRVGWFAVGVFWLMPFFLDNLSGGLARSFAAPLLAFFCLSWLASSPWGLGLALLLQALFIPYIFVSAAGAILLAWLLGHLGWGPPPPFPRRLVHFVVLALACGLVAAMQRQFNAAGYGPLVSAAEMLNHPEFTAQGRYAILPVPSFFWEIISPWQYISPFEIGGLVLGVCGCVLLLGAAVFGGMRVPWQNLQSRAWPFIYLLLSSLFLYFLARIFLLKLFVPDRYLIYTLNLIYCLALALCLERALRPGSWPRGLKAAALVLVAVLSGLRLYGVGLYDYSAYRPLYAALDRTPKSAIIAGHPHLLDNVPCFAQRRALATFELAHPWSKGYWEQIRPRLEDLFTAYYAEDPQVVRNFCRKHQISFLVVDDRHFTPQFLAGGRLPVPFDAPPKSGKKRLSERVACPFFAPFADLIRQQVRERSRFALLDRDIFPGRTVDEHLRLLDMRSCFQGGPSSAGY